MGLDLEHLHNGERLISEINASDWLDDSFFFLLIYFQGSILLTTRNDCHNGEQAEDRQRAVCVHVNVRSPSARRNGRLKIENRSYSGIMGDESILQPLT